ncbi:MULTISPECIES: hypothetical protein [unclassified Curtobacterium]|uniref:hypothetical protein n=1 Tax=unclassified Curtobacterium TaxID=257496 RepID=UPI003A7F7B3C
MSADDFTKLVHDLGEVPANAGEGLDKAVQVSAHNIKDAWADKLAGAPNLPHGSRTITYELKRTRQSRSADIGAERGRSQARFVKVVETGAPTLGARGYGAGALAEEAPGFERGCEIAIDAALRKAGL